MGDEYRSLRMWRGGIMAGENVSNCRTYCTLRFNGSSWAGPVLSREKKLHRKCAEMYYPIPRDEVKKWHCIFQVNREWRRDGSTRWPTWRALNSTWETLNNRDRLVAREKKKVGSYCLMAILFLFYKVKTILEMDIGEMYPLWIELKSSDSEEQMVRNPHYSFR